MPLQLWTAIIILLQLSCTGQDPCHSKTTGIQASPAPPAQPADIAGIALPKGFHRIEATEGSFAAWLRGLPLKRDNTVYLYDGSPKPNQSAQFAVLDISVGNKDLQQCADAVMRLRAEYLYSQKKYDAIRFTDNEGTTYHFTTTYKKDRFNKYLERVFGMCGSASLSKQMHAVNIKKMQPGDVLIKGGFPGHAVIVMDMAVNEQGEKIYLLAQSYMPAQDIHILKNPNSDSFSPWYRLNDEADIVTPEYSFTDEQLKTW